MIVIACSYFISKFRQKGSVKMVYDGLIKERAAWFGPDIQNSNEWLIYLDDVEQKYIVRFNR